MNYRRRKKSSDIQRNGMLVLNVGETKQNKKTNLSRNVTQTNVRSGERDTRVMCTVGFSEHE